MKEIKQGIEYKMTILTPVHVGTGAELNASLECVLKKENLWIIDYDRLLSDPKVDPQDIAKRMEDRGFKIHRYLQEKALSAKALAKYELPNKLISGDGFPNRIIEQIRGSLFRPYIPGSTIKGAIRTALFWYFLKNDTRKLRLAKELLKNLRDVDERYLDDEIEKVLFGKDPNYDLMRAVYVTDSTPFSTKDAGLRVVWVYAPSQTGFVKKIKTLRSGRTFPLKNYAEVIEPEQMCTTTVKIDEYLFSDICERELHFRNRYEKIKIIPQVCNQFAQKLVDLEMKYYAGFDELTKEYDEKVAAPVRRGEFVLQLAWGTGIATKTVLELIGDPNLVENVRQKFRRRGAPLFDMVHTSCGGRVSFDRRRQTLVCNSCDTTELILGKNVFFPKTRKIAFENGKPAYPMGWIKLEEA